MVVEKNIKGKRENFACSARAQCLRFQWPQPLIKTAAGNDWLLLRPMEGQSDLSHCWPALCNSLDLYLIQSKSYIEREEGKLK